MFPLIAEAVRGVKVSVGGPYFNQMSVPIALLLVFLAGVGPALPWRKGSLELLRGKFRWPTLAAIASGVALAAAGVREPLAWLAFVLAIFSTGLLVVEFAEPASARRRTTGESWLVALWRVCASNRRRYGGYVVHWGILVLSVGVAASATFRSEQEWTIQRGATERLGRYEIRLDSVWAVKESNRDGVIAATTVSVGGRVLTQTQPPAQLLSIRDGADRHAGGARKPARGHLSGADGLRRRRNERYDQSHREPAGGLDLARRGDRGPGGTVRAVAGRR